MFRDVSIRLVTFLCWQHVPVFKSLVLFPCMRRSDGPLLITRSRSDVVSPVAAWSKEYPPTLSGNENLFPRDYLVAGPVVMSFRNLQNFYIVSDYGVITATVLSYFRNFFAKYSSNFEGRFFFVTSRYSSQTICARSQISKLIELVVFPTCFVTNCLILSTQIVFHK